MVTFYRSICRDSYYDFEWRLLNTAAITAVARVSPHSGARLQQIEGSSLDRSQVVGLTPPGYILPPHPRLFQADRTTGPYVPNWRSAGKPARSRRIPTIKPNFSPRHGRGATTARHAPVSVVRR